MPRAVFLTAHWRYLIMLNYVVDPALLREFVPAGTELDTFGGKTFVSLVGFRFEHTRVRGLPVPFHQHFDEVNLRFYVKRAEAGTQRRGVVFVREIVPRIAIAVTARLLFHENYVAMPMSHAVSHDRSLEGDQLAVEYGWHYEGAYSRLYARAEGIATLPLPGSLEEFITEHYWGYAKVPGNALEYEVAHPPWRIWPVTEAGYEGASEGLYGSAFANVLWREPSSAFLAEGSPITVYAGRRIS